MKISRAFIFASLAAVLGVAESQITELTECPTECIFTALAGTGCSDADTECACKADDFFTDIESCLQENCIEEEEELGMTAISKACFPDTQVPDEINTQVAVGPQPVTHSRAPGTETTVGVPDPSATAAAAAGVAAEATAADAISGVGLRNARSWYGILAVSSASVVFSWSMTG